MRVMGVVPITFIFDYYYVSDSTHICSSFTTTRMRSRPQGQGHNPKVKAKADILWPQAKAKA